MNKLFHFLALMVCISSMGTTNCASLPPVAMSLDADGDDGGKKEKKSSKRHRDDEVEGKGAKRQKVDDKDEKETQSIVPVLNKDPIKFVKQIKDLLEQGCSQESIVDAIRQQNINVNARIQIFDGHHDGNFLHVAIYWSNPRLLQLLVAADANLHTRIIDPGHARHGATPLHSAAAAGCFRSVQALINAGADLHAKINNPGYEFHRMTPLQIAVATSPCESNIRCLVAHGAHIDNTLCRSWSRPFNRQSVSRAMICGMTDRLINKIHELKQKKSAKIVSDTLTMLSHPLVAMVIEYANGDHTWLRMLEELWQQAG